MEILEGGQVALFRLEFCIDAVLKRVYLLNKIRVHTFLVIFAGQYTLFDPSLLEIAPE